MSHFPLSFFIAAVAIVAVAFITVLLGWEPIPIAVALALVIAAFAVHEKEANR